MFTLYASQFSLIFKIILFLYYHYCNERDQGMNKVDTRVGISIAAAASFTWAATARFPRSKTESIASLALHQVLWQAQKLGPRLIPQYMLSQYFEEPAKRTSARTRVGSMRATGDRKAVGSDQGGIFQKRVSILPNPPIFNLTIHRRPKVKQEQAYRGNFERDKERECILNADVGRRLQECHCPHDWVFLSISAIAFGGPSDQGCASTRELATGVCSET